MSIHFKTNRPPTLDGERLIEQLSASVDVTGATVSFDGEDHSTILVDLPNATTDQQATVASIVAAHDGAPGPSPRAAAGRAQARAQAMTQINQATTVGALKAGVIAYLQTL